MTTGSPRSLLHSLLACMPLALACNLLTGGEHLRFDAPPRSDGQPSLAGAGDASTAPDANAPCPPDEPGCSSAALAGELSDCQPPSDQACDWVSDCGCGALETCAADAARELFCRQVAANAAAPRGACSSDAACPRRHQCHLGLCVERCSESSDCSDEGSVCLPFVTRGPGVCSQPCDPLAATATSPSLQPCASGQSCIIIENGTLVATACAVAGSVPLGGACLDVRDCSVGLRCEGGACRQSCDLTQDACPRGTTCTPLDPPVPAIAGHDIGTCIPH